jgi:hypothetical protein
MLSSRLAVLREAAGPCVAAAVAASSITAAAWSNKSSWSNTTAACTERGTAALRLFEPAVHLDSARVVAEIGRPRKHPHWSEAVVHSCESATPSSSRLQGYATVVDGPLGPLPPPRPLDGERLDGLDTGPYLGQ